MNLRTEIDTNPNNPLFWIFRPIKIFMVKHSIRNAVWYFPNIKVIYYHVPKSAGVSILRTLESISTCKNISKRKANKMENVIKFTFKRNPLNRLNSAYKFTMQDPHFIKKYHLKEDSCLEEWLKKAKNDFHSKGFWDLYKDVKFDFIGNFENINEDWEDFIKFANLNELQLPLLNKTAIKHGDKQ